MACCSCVTGRGTREMAGVRPRKSNCHRHVLPLTFYLPVWVPIGGIYTQNLDYCSYCDCLIKWDANIKFAWPTKGCPIYYSSVYIMNTESRPHPFHNTYTHSDKTTSGTVSNGATASDKPSNQWERESPCLFVMYVCVCVCTYRAVLMYECVCVLLGRVKPVSSGVTFYCAC